VITICVNNYNYDRFLGHTIDSALAEQEASATEVEVVVVDDGSTDRSREVIAAYGDRIRAVLTPNGGQGAAFNAGFAVAHGDIVLFLDSDDVLLPGVCDAVSVAFAADPRPVKVQVRMAVIDADGVRTGELIPGRARPHGPTDLRSHVRRFRSYPWPPSSANAYDADALRQVLPIPESEYRGSCDAYLAELLPYLGPVTSLSTVGVGYRAHSANDYFGTTMSVEWLRAKMARLVANHERTLELTRRLGSASPLEDPLAPRDIALLGFRMASLRLDPASHPFTGDTPGRLAVSGVRAALANPLLTGRDRLVRASWFLLTGLLPTRAAGAIVRRFVPDTPLRLRPAWLTPRGRPTAAGSDSSAT
jgi:glycosyltransferase involved in cell wall biosynthesis